MNPKPKRLHVLGVKVKEMLFFYMLADFLHTPKNRKEGAITSLSEENRKFHLKVLN